MRGGRKTRILEKFWYDNINPVKIPFQQQRQYNKVFIPLTKNEEKLLETLNKQKRIVRDCRDEIAQITKCFI